MKSFTLEKIRIRVITSADVSPSLGSMKDIANTEMHLLTFVDRTSKGQLKESIKDQTIRKQLKGMSVERYCGTACGDDIQINPVSQLREALMRH